MIGPCKKCGHPDLKIIYEARAVNLAGGIDEDFLRCTCKQCGYFWIAAPLDRPGAYPKGPE